MKRRSKFEAKVNQTHIIIYVMERIRKKRKRDQWFKQEEI